MDDEKRDSGNERRRETRHDVKLDGKIRLPADDPGNVHMIADAVIENLSHNGLCVYIPRLQKEHEPFLAEDNLKCAISCEAGCIDPFFLCGTAVWVQRDPSDARAGARLGIRLNCTEPEELDCLARFLEGFEARG